MSTIVVGVDGSAGSAAALKWAAGEARFRGAILDVVHVYDYRPAYELYVYPEGLASVGGIEDRDQEAQHARALVQQMVARVADEFSGLKVNELTYEDRAPAKVLVDLSKDADLLVVGSRGRGGFASLILGSVSQQCAQHAMCPVVIIPSDTTDG